MKTTRPKLSRMSKAAIAMFNAGAYDCGGDDRWCFPGAFESGCVELVKARFADTHPNGLGTFSYRAATLTTAGRLERRAMYRLNSAGRSYAEQMKREAGL